MKFTKPALYGIALSLLITCVFTSQVTAQRKLSVIRGVVQDSAGGKPLPFATVGLYASKDLEKPLRNLFSDNKGRYEFTKVDTGRYHVFASNAGYREKGSGLLIILKDTGVIELSPLLLATASQDLAVVTVSARRPLIEQTEDKLIYNAESDPSSEGLTAIDVLRKTPFLSVDGEGNVQLNGQSNFRVLLNGKETAMFTRNLKETLQSFPANLIKKVEVITSPSSKYDGEGIGGLINIITKKKMMGYNGSINVSRNIMLQRSGINTNISFKYGKLGFTGLYGYNRSEGIRSRTESETESLNPVAYYKRFSSTDRRNENFYNHGSAELSYDVDSLNTISVYANLNGGGGNNKRKRYFGTISPDKKDTLQSFYDELSEYEYPSFNWGTDYIRKFRKPEQELTMKMYHETSRDRNLDKSDYYQAGLTRFLLNHNNAKNLQSTWQIDYIHPLAKSNKVEIGAKAILRNATATYESRVRYDPHAKYEVDATNSDHFKYSQRVYSTYLTYRFNLKKFSFRIGARMEHTAVKGDFLQSKTTVRQDYTTWLPGVFISRKFNSIHTLSLSYNKRLSRPYIWDLNPYIYNADSLNIFYGNPKLEPEISHVFELAYTVVRGKTNINLRLAETFSNTQIARYYTFNETTGVYSGTNDNIGSYSSTSLGSNYNFQLGEKWRINGSFGGRYDFLRNRRNASQKNQGLGGWFGTTVNYEFSKKFNAFFNGSVYRSPVQLQRRNSVNYWYAVGTNHKFLKEKWVVSIQWQNFFDKEFVYRNTSRDTNFRTVSTSYAPAATIQISLRWNFGKLTENVSRKRGVTNDDLRSGGSGN